MLDTVIHNRDGGRPDEDDVRDSDVETFGRRSAGAGFGRELTRTETRAQREIPTGFASVD